DWDESAMDNIRQILEEQHTHLAAVILEPIVQGAGGMRFYHPEYLRQLRQLCNEYEVLLILDEIATGFGRSGKLFACEHADIAPDIMCVGKALTGGYMSLAATITTQQVSEHISLGDVNAGVFMHGPTFMANPMACALGVASIDLLINSDWQTKLSRMEQIMRIGLAEAEELKQVADVRVLGGIGVVEMNEPVHLADIQARFVQSGIWVRPFGKLVYIMPPYIISDDQLSKLCQVIVSVLRQN
ncbi:MAG: aminotransferase class III-fold pyridoxal phosphate-dependent enzyme, partial [Bacteroidota bacterium]